MDTNEEHLMEIEHLSNIEDVSKDNKDDKTAADLKEIKLSKSELKQINKDQKIAEELTKCNEKRLNRVSKRKEKSDVSSNISESESESYDENKKIKIERKAKIERKKKLKKSDKETFDEEVRIAAQRICKQRDLEKKRLQMEKRAKSFLDDEAEEGEEEDEIEESENNQESFEEDDYNVRYLSKKEKRKRNSFSDDQDEVQRHKRHRKVQYPSSSDQESPSGYKSSKYSHYKSKSSANRATTSSATQSRLDFFDSKERANTFQVMKLEVEYNFTPLRAIEKCQSGDIIDVKGYVFKIHEINQGGFTKNTQTTRRVDIVDEQMKILPCTLWNNQATNFKFDSIALKNVKVNVYNQKNVSVLEQTPIVVNNPKIGRRSHKEIESWGQKGQFVR